MSKKAKILKGNNFNCVFKGYKGAIYMPQKVRGHSKDKTLGKTTHDFENTNLTACMYQAAELTKEK